MVKEKKEKREGCGGNEERQREEKKKVPKRKGRSKLFLLADDMILYGENPKESTFTYKNKVNKRLQQGCRIND